jgi:uncharacterized protein
LTVKSFWKNWLFLKGQKILYNEIMQREHVLQILHQNKAEINTYGVKTLALFGSVARGEAHPGSDVDLLVEFDRPVGLFGLIALQQRLEELLGCSVDLGTPDSLKNRIRTQIMEDCVYVS